MGDVSILFLGKEDKPFVEGAATFVRQHFRSCDVHLGSKADCFPVAKNEKSWDFIISYLSPWIVPQWLLVKAKVAAINFHPGPPEYPGIGCTNFAIYDRVAKYGVTCHHMEPKVDAGKIITLRRFPVHDQESVYSLTIRCYAELLSLFFEVMDRILNSNSLSESKEMWRRKAYTKGELDTLCEVKENMDLTEVRRRIKATTFPNMPGAFMILDGRKIFGKEILDYFNTGRKVSKE